MIRLQKIAPPTILTEKGTEWTQEYLDARNGDREMTDTIRFRYRHGDIKAALREEAHSKCIYCEAMVDFGETDHLNPVSCCPGQIVDWHNIGLACKECNTYKADYYAPAEPLINPFVDEPAEHLMFLGPSVFPIDGKGRRTQLQLKLNRMDLLQKRALRLERLIPLVDEWKNQPDGATKDLLRQAILDEGADAQEYAATVRGCIQVVLRWQWPLFEPEPIDPE